MLLPRGAPSDRAARARPGHSAHASLTPARASWHPRRTSATPRRFGASRVGHAWSACWATTPRDRSTLQSTARSCRRAFGGARCCSLTRPRCSSRAWRRPRHCLSAARAATYGSTGTRCAAWPGRAVRLLHSCLSAPTRAAGRHVCTRMPCPHGGALHERHTAGTAHAHTATPVCAAGSAGGPSRGAQDRDVHRGARAGQAAAVHRL